jgi:hypothetical protein
MPSTIVILRHAEKPLRGKKSSLELSLKGRKRAQFLKEAYLGEGAKRSLFGVAGPDAFIAITPHTAETACPSAESWKLPVIVYGTEVKGRARDHALDMRTQQAADDVRTSGFKTVVMVWEHKRIANKANDPEITLRRLLNIEAAPKDWPDDDFDTIWIVHYGKNGKVTRFEKLRQRFRLRRTAKTPKKSKRATAKKTRKKARNPKAKKRRA